MLTPKLQYLFKALESNPRKTPEQQQLLSLLTEISKFDEDVVESPDMQPAVEPAGANQQMLSGIFIRPAGKLCPNCGHTLKS